MSNDDKKVSLMFLKEQVLRWSASKIHQHQCTDITDIANEYAPKSHMDETGGNGQTGHVSVDNNMSDSSSNPVQNKMIKKYIDDAITTLSDNLTSTLQSKLNITQTVDNNSTSNDIPTAKAVWNAIKNYKDLLKGVALDNPISYNKSIDEFTDAGYYTQTGERYFSYGGEAIHYKNALIKVEKQNNRIIQHVYATNKIALSNNTYDFRLNGAEYTRWGTSSTNWQPWHLVHKPYTKTTRACNEGDGVDTNAIIVYENTSGFIIHWDQDNAYDDRYPVTAPLYEYKTVCEFSPALPIKGPYVFGNIIGRCDFKITSDKMQIRTNINPGGRIIGVHETFFVPRNQ